MSSTLKSKSPAEFFAEHQNIAGFDNPGKSLYTTIREFVENSLDAAEAAGVLPEVEVTVEKLSAEEFNRVRGVKKLDRKDESLYSKAKASKLKKATGRGGKAEGKGEKKTSARKSKASTGSGKAGEGKNYRFFKVTCKDNGIGMPHKEIPNMLGIVLSSTKYGVKQTRGKFGLGAKMALVWSKKSTGLPIEVWSARQDRSLSFCKLDIDINKNQPHVITHESTSNINNWRGTEITVTIGGNWTSYSSKVVRYMRELAIITPYAHFTFKYVDQDDSNKSFSIEFKRRSEVMPNDPETMKHHPSAVDNLLVEQLIYHSKIHTLKKFLCRDFSCISPTHASRLVQELGASFAEDMDIRELSKKEIHQITRLLRAASFPKPSSTYLSPAGEYNLRLGIIKEINPDLVATHTMPPGVYEGHPFIVEAAVAVGGKNAKPGVRVHRFANRIPLLFESGNDIASVIANKKIKWGAYKIKQKEDKVGVYVSIVSTKIPFKGTSKEYIGDDKGEMHHAVANAIQQCCLQLKKRIQRNTEIKNQEIRKKGLTKYVPDVCRALMTVLNTMAGVENKQPGKKQRALTKGKKGKGGDGDDRGKIFVMKSILLRDEQANTEGAVGGSTPAKGSGRRRRGGKRSSGDTNEVETTTSKRRRLSRNASSTTASTESSSSSSSSSSSLLPQVAVPTKLKALARDLLGQVQHNRLNQDTLKHHLLTHIDRVDSRMALEYITSQGRATSDRSDIFIPPVIRSCLGSALFHPLFRIKLLRDAEKSGEE